MRIRKHARISAPSSSIVPDPPAAHVCELNRSPWDVISFTSLTQEYEFQDKINGDYTCHSVERESVYAPHSNGSKKEKYWAKKVKKEMIEEEEEVNGNDDDDDRVKTKKKIKTKREDMDYICCNKADGKGWHCKNEAKEGQLLCEHHLEQLKTYHYNYSSYKVCSKKSIKVKPEPEVVVSTVAAKTVVAAANKKKKRARVSATSPTDFYFYSGFGPSYSTGRKRRAGIEIKKEEEGSIVDATNNTQASSSSVVHAAQDPVDDGLNNDDHVVDDFYEDTDDDDDKIEDGKKRIRKPIKARSLKSLL
ncbi:Growth-regulating factor like [Thalictrum thalictroides]|uniref:Growth-regulating factor like n=1 Tax=Thalictrum thalictroides TaxID=46969 RepID=A0A7J6VK21_THATH|nr:Growth-regulating factor like [Thalictrum thalictroides]